MRLLHAVFLLIKDSVAAFLRDQATIYAAGLAYYTIFALAPLLILVISVSGFFIGRSAASDQIIRHLEYLVGAQLTGFLEGVVRAINNQAAGGALTVISVVVLLLGASGIFNQLRTALNILWGIVADRPENAREVLLLARSRTIPFLMIFVLGLMLSMVVLLETLAGIVRARLEVLFPEAAALMPSINWFIIPGLTFLTFTLIYKVLPDARTRWRDVALGALLAMLLFLLGRYVLFQFLTPGSNSAVYGAASSLIGLLVWVYYSAIILLFGAEFIKVYAARYGQPIRPSETARFRGDPVISDWASTKTLQPDDRLA